MVEYSSPNTNKPLHLGHVRNCLLGWSCSRILDAAGYDVVKTQIVNDRGVAICKSMLAWQKFGEGKTPESEGVKGDHFVGDFYVMFENKTKAEYDDLATNRCGAGIFCRKTQTRTGGRKTFLKNIKTSGSMSTPNWAQRCGRCCCEMGSRRPRHRGALAPR
jgi:arginyl-tRNA synthetase